MKKYMLDTNICIYILNKTSANLIRKLTIHDPQDISISSIVYAELLYGISKSSRRQKNREALESLLKNISIEPFDAKICDIYGDIRLALEKQGKLIGPYDMFIAAHAIACNSVLVTHNIREFARVPGLEAEDWMIIE